MISWRGEPIIHAAFGFADRANERLNTRNTLFGIASGTKFITALSIMKLYESGRIDLKSDIRDIIGINFKGCTKPVTIHHLLSHTAGVPDYFDEDIVGDNDSFFLKIPWHQLTRPLDYLPLHEGEPMKFQPGERFSYSNGGYIMLGAAIEKITGQHFNIFAEQEVLRRCGLKRAGFYPMNELPADTANGYMVKNGTYKTNIYNLPIIGASDGGMFATVSDIDLLWDTFQHGGIVAPETRDLMKTSHAIADNSKGKRYGYGLWIRNESAYREVSIVGYDAGVSFFSSVNEEIELKMTFVSNISEGIWDAVKKVYHLFYHS
ncbi:MAG: beta-lactamase family protein [Chitinivibrionales bacterium]|nr:beta-lactamase family protein [Chitinivibrionales bacterium]